MSKTPKITPLGLRAASQRPNEYYQYSCAPQAPSQPHVPPQSAASRALPREPQSSPQVSARVGLQNPGNCCFINSVLQCLATCRDFVLRDFSLTNSKSKFRGRLAYEFARLMRELRASRFAADAAPLRSVVRAHAPMFSGETQQDAHEFLRFLLSSLSDELNRVAYPVRSVSISQGSTRAETANLWLSYFESRESSLVTDAFRGQLMTTAQCGACGAETLACDTFLDLSLAVGARSLEECLDLFTSRTAAEDFLCERCHRSGSSTVQTSIWRLPPILVLHLKRFTTALGSSRKLDCEVSFPVVLRMGKYQSRETAYQLQAVVHHSGEAASGHYAA